VNALTTRGGTASLAPQTWAEARQFAEMLAQSSMIPKDYAGKPANIMVAVQWGAEVGLGPLQALNGISVINGRPSIWGDAALALVRGHSACEWLREGIAGEGDARHGWCEVKRRGSPEPERREFSVSDAKRAGLWGKAGPWQQYPDRMLQMRARGFAIRDVFPDALRGVMTAEEAQDMPAEPRDVPNLAAPPPGSMREAVAQMARPPAEDRVSAGVSALVERIAAVADLASLEALTGEPAIVKQRAWLADNRPDEAERITRAVNTALERVADDAEPGADA
jgi:hypothetical protein